MIVRTALFIVLSLTLAQTSFGESSCTNLPASPVTIDDTLYTQFSCSLYDDASSYTIPLAALETEGGADISQNALSAGYVVVINGDPNALPDDNTGLFNESLWSTVLFFAGDLYDGTASDSLTVYWPGAFPSASDVQTFDENLYGGGPDVDPEFFIQSSGYPGPTVYAPDDNHEYDIYGTPEPGTMALLSSGLAMLGGAVLRRRWKARIA